MESLIPPGADRMEAKPWQLFQITRQIAKLHLKMHTCSITKLPSQTERYSRAIKESADKLGIWNKEF